MRKEKRFCRNGSNRGCQNIGREKSRMKEKKFTEVFNKYNRLVRKMVISRSGNDMLAEEICQQVFLQYFEQMNNISEELIQPWLLLTTRNMVYDYLRKM
jgi:DNA-directed RNA polymerase specialized sigma24 family protein